MRAYHEVTPGELGSVLSNGLKRTSRGAKGDDKLIIQTDAFLDKHRPHSLKEKGVSRNTNLYAYIGDGATIVDITDGREVALDRFIATGTQAVLELKLDLTRCYVSDLDTYDALKKAIGQHQGTDRLETLAASYWRKLQPLATFKIGDIRRPEIMVTYDVEAGDVRRLD